MREKGRGQFQKPAKETLRSNIKDYIQQKIAEGAYRPGDRIVETQLARELNVSQAPVRGGHSGVGLQWPFGGASLFRQLCAAADLVGD